MDLYIECFRMYGRSGSGIPGCKSAGGGSSSDRTRILLQSSRSMGRTLVLYVYQARRDSESPFGGPGNSRPRSQSRSAITVAVAISQRDPGHHFCCVPTFSRAASLRVRSADVIGGIASESEDVDIIGGRLPRCEP